MGSESAAKFLIEKSCKNGGMGNANAILTDTVNINGESALHAAAYGGLQDVAASLLRRGANPNIQVYTNCKFRY